MIPSTRWKEDSEYDTCGRNEGASRREDDIRGHLDFAVVLNGTGLTGAALRAGARGNPSKKRPILSTTISSFPQEDATQHSSSITNKELKFRLRYKQVLLMGW